MDHSRFARLAVVALLALILLCTSSWAQHLVSLTDRQWIELAIDMIRKGVQQEDTSKVFMVFAPEVFVKGEKKVVRGNLTRELQAIFDKSAERRLLVDKPTFARADNPLLFSDFWDFDILDPEIAIEGDSAEVDCELVLWGALPEPLSEQAGRRSREKFVFVSPQKAQHEYPADGAARFPGSSKRRNRGWQVAGFSTLLDFLANHGDTQMMQENEQGEGDEKTIQLQD